MTVRVHVRGKRVLLTQSMLQAVPLESNEGGILTERLASYAQEAPVLDAWLARFPTLCHHLPAQKALPEVAAAVDGVAKRILASKAAVLAIKVSLTALPHSPMLSETSLFPAAV